MILDDERRAFLVSPVMIVVAGCGADLRPSIARALGARLGAGDEVELVVSRWQWPTLVDDVAERGGVAVTFVRPNDYVTYQVKGRGRVRAAGPDDFALVERYVATVSATLSALGVPAPVMAPWLVPRDLVVIAVSVEEIYVQTPGAAAGSRLEPAR
jgi:hypothetical protein